MKKKSLLILCFLTSVLGILAQPRFVPDQEIKRVGEILFQKPHRIVFGFTNKGNKPLLITNIHPSCGCTQVEYTNTAVEPGQRGEITAIYDAALLGTFAKELEVYTNQSEEPVWLGFQGCVVTAMQEFTGDFPIDLGNVKLSTNYLEFDNVNRGDRPVAELQIANKERTAFRPELMHLPPYLKAEYLPENIPGGRTGRVRLTLDSEKLSTLGLNQTSVYLARYMGDKVGESNEILISAVLLPNFSKLTAQEIAKAPAMKISETDIDLGEMGKKKQLSHTVIITNQGLTTLNIRQLQVFNRAVGVSLTNRSLAPGKSAKLKITVSAAFLKKAKNRPRVLIISDDPHHSMETINIRVKN